MGALTQATCWPRSSRNILCEEEAKAHGLRLTVGSFLTAVVKDSHRGATRDKSLVFMRVNPPTWSPLRPTGPARVSFLGVT